MTKLCHACTADPKAAAADDDLGVRDFHAEFGLRGSRVHGCKTLLPTFRYNGGIDRRGFLDGAAKFAVGGLTAAGLLEALSAKFAQAQQVLAADPRIKGAMVEFASPKGYGNARGYLVRPANASGPLPTVLVVHENRGLNPHIEDITRRLALDNFIAFAPDALFPLGGYPGDEDKARELFGKLDQAKTQGDFVAAAAYLKTVAGGNGKVGAVGFC